LGWGTLFVDVDNDGWPDLFMANGHVYPEIEGKSLSASFRQRKILYWNQHNGKFKDISLEARPGITTPFNSHGVAAADFDNDGAVEILVNNSHDAPSLLKNYGTHENWILLKLVGTKSNRDAIGARVILVADGHQQLQELRGGGGYISQSDFRLHFGLVRQPGLIGWKSAGRADSSINWRMCRPIRSSRSRKVRAFSDVDLLCYAKGDRLSGQRSWLPGTDEIPQIR
jgi:hypothetical protein